MSLKVYNGIKFKSKDITEVISQLHSIKEQAVKNSNNNLIKQNSRFIRILIDNGLISNAEEVFTKTFSKDPDGYFDIDNLVQQNLESRIRKISDLDFNFYVVVIPWTDGNIYGISLHDGISENYELLKDFADEYHYQNQTDKPDEISDEEWFERDEIWNEIFDKYLCPNDAGLIYEVVTPSDVDYGISKRAIEEYKKERELGWSIIVKIKLDDYNEIKKFADKVISYFNDINIHILDYSFFSKAPSLFIYCKNDEAKNKVIDVLKEYSSEIEYDSIQEHINQKYFSKQ